MIYAIETRAETSITKRLLRTTETRTQGASLATLCGIELATRTFGTSAGSKMPQDGPESGAERVNGITDLQKSRRMENQTTPGHLDGLQNVDETLKVGH
jgi:hypothetical protein